MCVPFLQGAFKLASLVPVQWAIVSGLSLTPLVVVELLKALKLNTLEKMVWALEDMAPVVTVPPDIAEKALLPIRRMLEIG
jgi:quinolinate synthase